MVVLQKEKNYYSLQVNYHEKHKIHNSMEII